MHPQSGIWIAKNWSLIGETTIRCWYDVIVNFFDIVVFLLSYFVNDLTLMSI